MLTFISIGSRACLICVLLLCECGAWLCPSPISSAIKDGVKRIQVSALDLSQNGLTYISNSTFSGIYLKLVNLSLANNLLLCVGQDSFSGLAVLERLDLSGNNLSHIHVNTFSCNRKLYWLSLADNKLFTLPPQDAFIHVSALTFLDLSNCSAVNISEQSFKGINNVIYLNMSHNSIFDIQQRSFRPLNQLRCLDISFNDLSSLDVDVFISNTNIIGYNSSEGCETWLETEYTLPVVKLKADNNPWHCNCAMKILFDYVSEHNSSSLDLTCKEPARLENTSWKELKHLDCTTSTATAVRLVTEESTVHILMVTPTTPVSNPSEKELIGILILLLTVFVVICAVLAVCVYKLRKQQPRMRVDAGIRREEEEEEEEEEETVL